LRLFHPLLLLAQELLHLLQMVFLLPPKALKSSSSSSSSSSSRPHCSRRTDHILQHNSPTPHCHPYHHKSRLT
uniref:Secreted protein n=1 Tax=Anisakis simplex TaxID=6269 RepID=A0A0M3JGT0_ANISI